MATTATGMWDTTGMARVPPLHRTKFAVDYNVKMYDFIIPYLKSECVLKKLVSQLQVQVQNLNLQRL